MLGVKDKGILLQIIKRCNRVIEKLKHERYECIRQNPRFIENIKKLNQYAK